MRREILSALVGLLCLLLGLQQTLATCGPVLEEGHTCGPEWSTFCATEGCQVVETGNTCPDGKEYNAVVQGPPKYLGYCVTVNPPNPEAECTSMCYLCSDKKYYLPNPNLGGCLPERLACDGPVIRSGLRCQ